MRVSNQWEEDIIPDHHLLYAAKDAYASLSLYNHLCSIPTPSSISSSTPIGTAVTLHHNDGTKTAVARGHLIAVGQDSPHSDTPPPKKFDVPQGLKNTLVRSGEVPRYPHFGLFGKFPDDLGTLIVS